MTTPVIAPLVPGEADRREQRPAVRRRGGMRKRRPLPLAEVPTSRTGSAVYGVAALVRHRCGLNTGDRVLLVADPTTATLRVVPPAMLDRLLSSVDERIPAGPQCGGGSR